MIVGVTGFAISWLTMRDGLNIGSRGELTWPVDPTQTITLGPPGTLGPQSERSDPGVAVLSASATTVFSTPAMINLMEHAAREALRPFLEASEESVGIDVQVQHLAATPLGATVRGEATVTGVDGRQVTFDIAAFDGKEQIGRGTHRRAVVNIDKLAQKIAEKKAMLRPDSAEAPTDRLLKPIAGPLPSFDTLNVEHRGAVLHVTLNRPGKLNAVDVRMTAEWRQLIGWLAGHGEAVRVVIITGAGRAFCAGDDVREVGTLDIETARRLSHDQAEMYLAFERLPQPMIATINGPCFGAGCVMAYSCDFRFAAHGVPIGMPEIKLGWPPGYGVAQLTALIGKARAMDLCLTGRTITAEQARDWGLVNEVLPANRLLAHAEQFADALLTQAPGALRATKRLVHADENASAKLMYRQDTEAYIRCMESAEAREGIAAFNEKRSPNWP